MRNRYPGTCYRCGGHVEVGAGHFERFLGGWRTQHADCAIKHRGSPDTAREEWNLERLKRSASVPGKRGQRARRRLRELETDSRE